MGLNAYFMTVVLSSNGAVTWQAALGAVFISGIIFLILTVTKIRQLLLVAVPQSLKAAITVGIGLFVASLGLKMSNLIGAGVTGNVAGDSFCIESTRCDANWYRGNDFNWYSDGGYRS
ncbi:Guanine/hypoxanthine permease PbuO [compost metagenome]